MTDSWAERYATRTQGMKSSAIRDLLKLTQRPDIISFAGGLPAPELFPTERVLEASRRVMELQGCDALQYSTTEGYPPLRAYAAEQMARLGVPCTEDNILITAGSQQALDLVGKMMLDPGDQIAVDNPTYLGALQAWMAYEADFLIVPMDEEGLRIDQLEEALQTSRPKFIYAQPNFHNPTGTSLSHGRRMALARVAAAYGVPIVEDDPYQRLRYEGVDEPPLIALDAAGAGNLDDGNVLYLTTFSKTLCPGFRVAWMAGPKHVITRMVQAKQGTDLHTGTYAQMVTYETARDGFVDEHVETIRRVYDERRRLMLSLMAALFPPGVTWTRPKGGLFVWVSLPPTMDSASLLEKAVESKVAFVPGEPFHAKGGGRNTLRMNFSNAQPEQIEQGMKRLAAVIETEMVKAKVV
jgi:2-aminoadipate transaminase